MIQALEFVSALHFLIRESFADKRSAGEVFNVGDRVLVVDGPYAGTKAEAVRMKQLSKSRYLYLRDLESGKELTYPICFARQLETLKSA